jgi:hypothetical protein
VVVVLPTPPFWFITAIVRMESIPQRGFGKGGKVYR